MDERVKMASLYIEGLLNLPVKLSEERPRQLPGHGAGNGEKTCFDAVTGQMAENAVCFLHGRKNVQYCVVHAADVWLTVGPYLLRQDACEPKARPLAVAEKETVKRAVYLLLYGVYGSTRETLEIEADLCAGIHQPGETSENGPRDLRAHETFFQRHLARYMAQVEQANYSQAMREYEQLLQNVSFEPEIFGRQASEGLAHIRAATRMAAIRAGLRAEELKPLTDAFKKGARMARSRQDAVRLVSRLAGDTCLAIQQKRRRKCSEGVARALDFIHENWSRPLTVREIARRAGLSPNWLSASFAKQVGIPVSAYIREIRLRQAAHLLRETDSPIQEIASYIGMPDNNYFSRCFRVRYGVSPTAYRHGGNAL